jgi:REP element-mobilizing transposase RayT/DNA-binding response OmpR family regulator
VQKSILVTSPHRAFAELLRSSLEESGRYRVRLAFTAQEALAAAEEGGFNLAVLDSDIEDEAPARTAKRLAALHPALLLMVIPPENDPNHPSLVDMPPHSYLERSFYLPDLLNRLDQLLGLAQINDWNLLGAPAASEFSGWVQNEQQVSSDMKLALADTNFVNAVLIQAGRVLGSSSQLNHQDGLSTAEWIGRHWDQTSDMVRYTGEHLLYVTRLWNSLALSTVSDASLPLTQVRSCTRKMAKRLLERILEHEQGVEESRWLADVDARRMKTAAGPWTDQALDGLILPEMEADPQDTELADDPERGQVITLSDLMDEMTPTDHERIISRSEWEAAAPDNALEVQPSRNAAVEGKKAPPYVVPDLILPWEDEALNTELLAPSVSDTHPAHSLEDRLEEPGSTLPVFVQILFTCILIPANPNHHLVGDMAKSLKHWLPQVCLGFGWQLEKMTIEPGYMLWVVNVTPTVSPGSVVRMVRSRTSEQIFTQFPDLLEQNMNGDFWAPGYLVISGSQTPTQQLVRDFISQTRRRQGIF